MAASITGLTKPFRRPNDFLDFKERFDMVSNAFNGSVEKKGKFLPMYLMENEKRVCPKMGEKDQYEYRIIAEQLS